MTLVHSRLSSTEPQELPTSRTTEIPCPVSETPSRQCAKLPRCSKYRRASLLQLREYAYEPQMLLAGALARIRVLTIRQNAFYKELLLSCRPVVPDSRSRRPQSQPWPLPYSFALGPGPRATDQGPHTLRPVQRAQEQLSP